MPRAIREEIDGLVQGLLGLVGVDSDPLSGREHVLLANLVDHAWTAGQNLDLAALLGQIQNPPMRKLGVIEVDTFFPPEGPHRAGDEAQRPAGVARLRGVG